MKKAFIACFFAIIMLMIPITSAVQTANVSNDENFFVANEGLPKFYITSAQSTILTNYIDENFEGTEKQEAIAVVQNIISDDYRVDLINLSNYMETYIYTPIDENVLFNVQTMGELEDLILDHWGFDENGFLQNLFGALLIKIIDFLKDRLGWFYDLFDKSISLFYNSINILVDTIKPLGLLITVSFVALINQILSAPKAFYEALRDLFEPEGDDFIDTLTTFADNFASNVSSLIDDILNLIQNPQISNYFNQLQGYFDWLDEAHWKDDIHVSGSVKTLLGDAWTDVTIHCRGQSTNTDNNGEFSFYVDPMPDNDSYPQNEYYGLHNCQIIVKRNGEILKQNLKILSYSFSGGEIEWSFVIQKGKSTPNIIVRLLQKLIDLFPILEPLLQPIIDRF